MKTQLTPLGSTRKYLAGLRVCFPLLSIETPSLKFYCASFLYAKGLVDLSMDQPHLLSTTMDVAVSATLNLGYSGTPAFFKK